MVEQPKVPLLITEGADSLRDIGRPPMVIEELLPVGAITFISGAKYTGKTFFALEAARAVATGTPFMGKWPVSRPGNVLIVEQDSPRYDTGPAFWGMLVKQWAAWRDSKEEEGNPAGPILISWHPGINLLERRDAMRVAQTANAMYTWRGEATYERPEVDVNGDLTVNREHHDFGYRGASLIILDSARSLHRGKEDKSDDMETFIQNLKYIRQETGAAIIIIAHDNAAGEKTRGSTAIEAGADSEYNITKRKAKRDHGVFIRKARAIAPQEFRYNVITEEETELGTIKRVEFKEFIEEAQDEEPEVEGVREQLMAFIASGPKELQSDLAPWAEQHALGERTMKKYLADAVTTGYLVTTYRKEGRKQFAIYAVRGAV